MNWKLGLAKPEAMTAKRMNVQFRFHTRFAQGEIILNTTFGGDAVIASMNEEGRWSILVDSELRFEFCLRSVIH